MVPDKKREKNRTRKNVTIILRNNTQVLTIVKHYGNVNKFRCKYTDLYYNVFAVEKMALVFVCDNVRNKAKKGAAGRS